MIKSFSPELNTLRAMAEKKFKSALSHTEEILNSEKPTTKIIGEKIGKAIANGPNNFVNDVKEISAPIRTMAEKAVERLKENQDPISQKASQIIREHQNLNPVNIINKTEEAIKTYSKVVSDSIDEIGKEATKTIIKEKTNTFVKTSFLDKIKNFIQKFKKFLKSKLKIFQ